MIVHSIENKNQKTEVQETWISGPSILATFYTENNTIVRITLAEAKRLSCAIISKGLESEILEWMILYSKRKTGNPLPLEFTLFSPFMKKGLQAIEKIPFGEVASYGEIASLAGEEKGARAIGNVCNKNPYPLVIPCHRVIQGNGSLGGFDYPLKMKELMLEFETQSKVLSLGKSHSS